MKKYKLGDIAILNASIIDKKKNIEIEYLDTSSILEGHILGTQKICLSEAPSRAQRKVKNKTIIYSLVRPNQNHYGILYNTPDNFIVSTGFATIDLKEEFKETIDADFLFLLLTQKQITHHLHRIAENSASAYPSLIPSDITKLELNFPSIKKQKNIARLIQNINQKIELNRSINHNLEVMAKQLYDYWFLQFDFPDENGKPYKSSGGKMVWNKKLKREIPEGWELTYLRDFINLEDNKRIPLSSKERSIRQGKYPYYGATGIMDRVDDYLFDDDRILLAEDGSTSTPEGTPIIQYVWGKYWVNNHAHIIIPKDKENILYTYQLLNRIPAKKIETGSIQKKISQENMLGYRFDLPPQALIKDYCTIVTPLWEQYKQITEQITSLTKQRDELLPLLMNGQASPQNCD